MPKFNSSFVMNHTCLRIKNPKVSIPFYRDNFGMKLVKELPFPEMKFTLYMMGYENSEAIKKLGWTAIEGILELCHNHGVENDENYSLNNGNGSEFRGFGHICFSVDNIEEAQKSLLEKGVAFHKKLSDGRQKNIAFALDPCGYWIELIENGINKTSLTNPENYRLNHTMIRVKDPKKSLDFYRNVLGMKLLSTSVHENAKFTLYFLGYEHNPSFKEETLSRDDQSKKQALIELTHNWGTESDPEFKGYHNGNITENGARQGYGHTCVSCDDPTKFCQEIEEEYGDKINWAVKFNQGKMKNLGFIRDPDGYSIEILPTNFDS